MSEEKQKFLNFAALTVSITAAEQKETKEGKKYTVAAGTIPAAKDAPIRIVALNGISGKLKPGTVTLVGRLGYDEHEGKEGKTSTVVLYPTKVEKAVPDKPRCFVSLTLRAGQDGEERCAESNGNFWARVRAALSMGKDGEGNYRPSLWLTVKGFTGKDGDETVAEAISSFHKGSLIDVEGRLTYEIYQEKGYWGINARKAVLNGGEQPADTETEAVDTAEPVLENLDEVPD